MAAMRISLVLTALILGAPLGFAKTFAGFECTEDCSGHIAGYEWAKRNDITDPDDCGGYSQSFIQGCQAYADGLSPDIEGDDEEDDPPDAYWTRGRAQRPMVIIAPSREANEFGRFDVPSLPRGFKLDPPQAPAPPPHDLTVIPPLDLSAEGNTPPRRARASKCHYDSAMTDDEIAVCRAEAKR